MLKDTVNALKEKIKSLEEPGALSKTDVTPDPMPAQFTPRSAQEPVEKKKATVGSKKAPKQGTHIEPEPEPQPDPEPGAEASSTTTADPEANPPTQP